MEDKTKKLGGLLEYAVDKSRGNFVRALMRIIAKAYEKNPETLRRYFNHENQKIAGIATSAYHFLTGDIKPIQTRNFGGLGAIINDSEESLKFGRNQLNFAKLCGDALWYSENNGYALWHSENNGNALWKSENSGDALENSRQRKN